MIFKCWMTKLFKMVSLCTISSEIRYWNVHCFNPVITLIIIIKHWPVGIVMTSPWNNHLCCTCFYLLITVVFLNCYGVSNGVSNLLVLQLVHANNRQRKPQSSALLFLHEGNPPVIHKKTKNAESHTMALRQHDGTPPCIHCVVTEMYLKHSAR